VFFADFSGDASNKIVNGSHSSERYAIAVGQTLTSSAVFLHAPLLVAMGPSDAPLTVGLLWYIVICLLLTVMYQITGKDHWKVQLKKIWLKIIVARCRCGCDAFHWRRL
jgi:hypothetical protein